jgi:hypothetical protein
VLSAKFFLPLNPKINNIMTALDFNKQNSEASFNQIMNSKGEIAPIAEKACRNFELKTKNFDKEQKQDINNNAERLFYFAVGHTIKSMLNQKTIFDYKIEDGSAQQFKLLNQNSFNKDFCERLLNKETRKGLLDNVRNLNNHYIHCFNGIKLNTTTDLQFINFLKECFHVALIQVYIKENNIDYDKEKFDNKKLVAFLFERFKNRQNEKFWSHIKELSLNQAIEAILFANIEEDLQYRIINKEEITVSAGKYLSFYGCLFLLSLFLYKSEAELLISKIYGFKKQKEVEDKSKRELFTYYCKKTSSRDSEVETPDLVNFRDIIGYLNKYPTQWNKEYEIENEADKSPLLTKLKNKLIELEIDKMFFRAAEYNDPEIDQAELEDTRCKFGRYARFHVFKIGKAKSLNDLGGNEKKFYKLIYDHATQRDAEEKLILIEKQKAEHPDRNYEYEKNRLNEIIEKCKADEKTSDELTRINARLENHEFFRSQGRNQDRFMYFAMRFLAETNYFGRQAKFRVQQYHSPETNRQKLKELKQTLPKKEYDKLKIHDGHLVDFHTWQEHLDRNPDSEWYNPFVVQNNAVQVQLTFNELCSASVTKTVTLQRNLIVYLLQHALRQKEADITGLGYTLLNTYYNVHANEYHAKKATLHQIPADDKKEKAAYKKLFPKRLLQTASPTVYESNPTPNYLTAIQDKAIAAEKRYKQLYDKAADKALFEKNNKGRQFKLSFIRSACNLMYFKEIYRKQFAREKKHHKRYHITRDEFNEFSRLMFGLDTNVQYCRKELSEMFKAKHFFDNPEFKSMFEASESFSDLYNRTKEHYTKWIETQTPKRKGTYTLDSYTGKKLMEGPLFFINTTHFTAFLMTECNWKPNNAGVLIFEALTDNEGKLIAEFYANTPKNTSTTSRKAHYTAKREDALLYNIALYYLKRELRKQNENITADINTLLGEKTSVTQLLTTKVSYKVKVNNQDYHIKIPINNLDAFLESVARKQKDETLNNGSSFMANLFKYLENIYQKEKDVTEKTNTDIFSICRQLHDTNEISFDQYQKINHHLLITSNKLTIVSMAMEKYFLEAGNSLKNMKYNTKSKCSYIKFSETGVPKSYFIDNEINYRNLASHFSVPINDSYLHRLAFIEKEFINEILKDKEKKTFNDFNAKEKTVCNQFFKTLHNEYQTINYKEINKQKEYTKTDDDIKAKFYNNYIKTNVL